ncbi:tetratricopeptide repeat protein [Moraxella sp. ZY210820]|uniref:tetratricopeptide repeat protein n=1 Tax=Moraxella sp. ZY210820 TaxID=2904123 RepID=UPI002730104E|nr:tetratricopeptide repeat protein [Moraxella sp. ZY210820]WLF84693.1 sel1 repeat family protein [Moraxella sp. ZY210820]
MKKLILSALFATVLFSAPAMAKVAPDIIKTSYGDFDAQGQLLSANPTALKAMDFKTVEKKANQGDNMAQFHLAKMYQLGIHTQKDEAKAQEWYKKSAENGNAFAMNNYANYLMNDESNSDIALSWLKKASDLNQPHAKMNLAIENIKKEMDIQKSVDILLELGDNGFAPAYFVLSQIDTELPENIQKSVYKDKSGSFRYLKQSAEMGFALAQMQLADTYQWGVMGPDKEDRILPIALAYKWSKRACTNGIERGCQVEQLYAPYKTQDLSQYQGKCTKGDENACESYELNKRLVEEMNKADN